MNIRHESRNNQLVISRLHIVFLSLGLFGIATLIAFMSKSSFVLTESVVKNTTTTIMTAISYREVPSGRQDVRRFIATSSTKEPISIKSWMDLVASKSEQGIKAARDLSNIISSSEYESVLFETMGASWSTGDTTPFEFALVNQPALKRFAESSPDRDSFDEHFRICVNEHNKNAESAGKGSNDIPTVCSFDNLGGDARLVSPVPLKDISDSSYSHLAAFVRHAPKEQVDAFWALGANQYLNELKTSGERKRWFSTNGMGVAWLHLRLDTWPKYYSYRPFT